MKKTAYLIIAALIAAGAITASCTKQEMPDMAEGQSVTLTANLRMEASQTKALTDQGVKTFSVGDRLAVVYVNTGGKTVKTTSAALTASDVMGGGKVATFTITLTDPDKTKEVTYIYPSSMAGDDGSVNYALLDTQSGTLDDLSARLDLCVFTGAWDGSFLPDGMMANKLVVCAFTIKDESGERDLTEGVTSMTIHDGAHTYKVRRHAGPGPVYVAMRPTSGAGMTYDAINAETLYSKSLDNESYEAGHFYPLGLRMTKLPYHFVDLETLGGDYQAQDNDLLVGTLGGYYQISVADGAAVTLRNVTISGTAANVPKDKVVRAGINLLGDATLHLAGSNSIRAFHYAYPGIHVPEGHTLTIDGDGKLDVNGNGGLSIGGTGIGGGFDAFAKLFGQDYKIHCGNIVINGGTITTASGIGSGVSSTCGNITINGGTIRASCDNGAGIGAGIFMGNAASCGNITINGGAVTASGGRDSPGIGSGSLSSCGDIYIAEGAVINATKSGDSTHSIGSGKAAQCGTVTIGGTIYWDGKAYQNGGDTFLTKSPLIYPETSKSGY